MQSFPYQLVILDRDGVINHDSDDYIKSPEEWHAIDGSLAAIAKLNQLGVKVAVASNQSGLARGYFDLVTLEQIHQKLNAELKAYNGHIDYLTYCSDHPDQPTERRKPNPGMLFEISEVLSIDLKKALFIGDSYSDYVAAQKAGCDFVLVKTGKGKRTLAKHSEISDTIAVFDSLDVAVDQILRSSQRTTY